MSNADDFYMDDLSLGDYIELNTDGLEEEVNDRITEAFEAGKAEGEGESEAAETLKELKRLYLKKKDLQKQTESVLKSMRLLLEDAK